MAGYGTACVTVSGTIGRRGKGNGKTLSGLVLIPVTPSGGAGAD